MKPLFYDRCFFCSEVSGQTVIEPSYFEQVCFKVALINIFLVTLGEVTMKNNATVQKEWRTNRELTPESAAALSFMVFQLNL